MHRKITESLRKRRLKLRFEKDGTRARAVNFTRDCHTFLTMKNTLTMMYNEISIFVLKESDSYQIKQISRNIAKTSVLFSN